MVIVAGERCPRCDDGLLFPYRGWFECDSCGRPAPPDDDVPAILSDAAARLGPALPVDGMQPDLDVAGCLADIEGFVRRFVVFANEHQVVAVALFVAHTWAIEAADSTPYLNPSSPAKRSGKTRLLEVLALITRGPLFVSNISEAALFRRIDSEPTTLLFDEVDAIFGPKASPKEDLRALLNSGHRRGAQVARMGGANNTTLQVFNVFGPKVLAGIGTLPDTIGDRCIPIKMARRRAGETVQRFRHRDAQLEAAPIRDALSSWGATAPPRLRAARPAFPPGLSDRGEDGWEPLLAIADEAGGDWPARARRAAQSLHGEREDEDESTPILLLAHIREAFDARQADRLATADLLAELIDREDGPWGGWWAAAVSKGETKGPASQLSRRLKPFGIVPKTLRIGTGSAKGYERESFREVWERYVSTPPPPVPTSNSLHVTPQAYESPGGFPTWERVPGTGRR